MTSGMILLILGIGLLICSVIVAIISFIVLSRKRRSLNTVLQQEYDILAGEDKYHDR